MVVTWWQAYDYLDTEVFPHFLAEEGPSGYKAMAFSLGAARLRKGLTSHKSATKVRQCQA